MPFCGCILASCQMTQICWANIIPFSNFEMTRRLSVNLLSGHPLHCADGKINSTQSNQTLTFTQPLTSPSTQRLPVWDIVYHILGANHCHKCDKHCPSSFPCMLCNLMLVDELVCLSDPKYNARQVQPYSTNQGWVGRQSMPTPENN